MAKRSSILEETEKQISALSQKEYGYKTARDNLNFMRYIGNPNISLLLLRSILDDEKMLETVARRSYKHVNYFNKIVLVDSSAPEKYRLTLHFWDGNYPDDIRKQELIHNHRFSFWSYVYKGSIKSENFIESPTRSIERKTFRRYIYRPSKTGNVHTCEYNGEMQLQRLDDKVVHERNAYYMHYKKIHRVALPKNGESLCTFVLRGPREQDFTYTYNTFYPKRRINSNVPMMTKDQLREKLNMVLGESN